MLHKHEHLLLELYEVAEVLFEAGSDRSWVATHEIAHLAHGVIGSK